MEHIDDSARHSGRSDETGQTVSCARKRMMQCLAAALLIGGLAACNDDKSPSKAASTSEPAPGKQASAKKTGATESSVRADQPSVSIDALRDYRNQTVQWAACDATILGKDGGENDSLRFDRLGPLLQCAQYRVPKDYANVGHGDLSIGVMRLAAATPQKRRGAVVFNPGGPGGDGLSDALHLLDAFAGSNPLDQLGGMQLRLLDEYDMIVFSPRGLGTSTRFNCGSNELLHLIDNSTEGAKPESLAKRDYNSEKIAQACQRNPLAPFINSNATAQDMDVLRSILGDEKLSYLGYSYGTWLGTRYTSLFPDRVDRMVLIGLMDVTQPMDTTVFRTPTARQRLLDQWLIPYANRHPDVFGLGATSAETQAILNALDTQMQHVLGDHLAGYGYSRHRADHYLLAINAAHAVQAFINDANGQGPFARFDQAAAAKAAENWQFVKNDAEMDEFTRELAVTMHRQYVNRWLYPTQRNQSLSLGEGKSVFTAVRCNDSPAIQDVAEYHRISRNAWRDAPLFAGMFADTTCAYWGGPSVPTPDMSAMKDMDVLLVQSHFDAATAVENATATFAALPNAHMLTLPKEFDHSVYPYKDRCVDQTVVAHLLGQRPLSRRFTCDAHPLPQDAKKTLADAGVARAPSPDGGPADTDPNALLMSLPADHPMRAYKDPAAAEASIRKFKERLVPLQNVRSIGANVF